LSSKLLSASLSRKIEKVVETINPFFGKLGYGFYELKIFRGNLSIFKKFFYF